MVIKPMIRNNICMNAHPAGCRRYVEQEIDYVRRQGRASGPRNVLVVGGSHGYGLASRVSAAFGFGAGTLGVAFEKAPSGKRTGSAGYYMMNAFDDAARDAGLVSETVNADAFAHETRKEVVERIRELFGTVDLVIYSLASGLRIDPDTGQQYRSVLKPIGNGYTAKTVDPFRGTVQEATVEPATDEEIEHTVKVMGGEDWKLWIDALLQGGVLAEGAMTVAYSYIGPNQLKPVYREGTIGRAKEHLESTAHALDESLKQLSGKAFVSVNKALVTRASAVIPVVPLYLSILFRIMKEKGIHEGPVEQMYRLFSDRLYGNGAVPTDDEGRIRMDELELRDDVQSEVDSLLPRVTDENLEEITDVEGYRTDFLQLHGFGFPEVDYDEDVEP